MFVSCRHSATTEANGNRSRGENGGNKINPDGIKTTSLIVFILLLVMLILLGLTLFIFNKKRKKEKGNSMSLCVVLLWLWMLFILNNGNKFWVRRSDPRKVLIWPYIENLLISLKKYFSPIYILKKINAWLWFPWSLPPKNVKFMTLAEGFRFLGKTNIAHSKMFKIVLHFLVYFHSHVI